MQTADHPQTSPATASVLLSGDGPVRVVTINRPERRNAVDRQTAEQLHDTLRALDADPDVAVIVLTGAAGTFCAGADLHAVAAGTPNRVASTGSAPMGPSRLQLSKPTIAAIEGFAVAGGLELALWCDLRVCAADATLGVYCRRFGVPLIDGGTARLPAIVGLGRALDLILTGRSVDATEALQIGLVTRVAPPGAALDVALKLGSALSAFPQACLRADRASVYAGIGRPLDEALIDELRSGAHVLEQESVPGAQAFRDGAGRGGASRT